MEALSMYVLESLIQKKGRDIAWIYAFTTGVTACINGIDVTKKQLKVWKHILTASRTGDEEVRMKYSLNMCAQFGLVAFYYVLWYFGSKFIFQDFHPLSYWDVNGSFLNSVFWISLPVIIFGFLSGQLDWFSSGDAYEEGTIIAESAPFKWLVSLVAGLTEELTHRSLMIFVGLASVYFANMMFIWTISFVVIIITLFILAKLEMPFVISSITLISVVLTLIGLDNHLPENPIYAFNGLLYSFLIWITSDVMRVGLFLFVLMTIARLIAIAGAQKEHPEYDISVAEFLLSVIFFTAFGAYAMPLGVQAIKTMPIIPANADHWTTLLYIGAVLWSNAKFRDGHKYQGLAGMLSSYVFGLYMFYIAFTHGLLYAIVVHAVYDTVLFSSEHMCQIWKNRHMLT